MEQSLLAFRTMKLYSLFILFFLLSSSVFASKIESLNSEKDSLILLIEINSRLLDEHSSQKNSEILQISLINSQIEQRKNLISIYRSEISTYSNQISVLSYKLDSLENLIFKVKDEYCKLIISESYNLPNSDIVYIFSAGSFNESYKRFLFLKQYNSYRREQMYKLQSLKNDFNELKSSIEQKKSQCDALIVKAQRESNELSKQIELKNNKISQLTFNENILREEILSSQERANELENLIVALIKEEQEKRSKENKSLSDDIISRKGELPWPTEKHVVTNFFGEHNHPLIESLVIRNNGIDFNIVDNADVKSIYKGTVSRIIMIPGGNASIIIKHGEVLTVYSNLAQVFVKKDQKIDSNTVIGKVFDGNGVNSKSLHFEIWKGDEKQNPLEWLVVV